jgi:hypothetical protein
MIQPSALPGLRQASTKPAAPNAADTHTGTIAAAGVQVLVRQPGQRHGGREQGQQDPADDQAGRP